MKRALPAPALEEQHSAALREAAVLLLQAQADGSSAAMHRSLRGLRLGPGGIAIPLCFGIVLTLVLWMSEASVMAAWEEIVLWWAGHLGIPLALDVDHAPPRWIHRAGPNALLPDLSTSVVTALLVAAAFASTWWMGDRLTPIKYLVRIICAVQASALLFFLLFPSRFPYTPGSHLASMLESGYLLMLAIPLLMAMGCVVLNTPRLQMVLEFTALQAYFLIALPHKAVLHMLVLQHFSALFMPLLYLCFGLVFDVMLFISLYSWLASRAQPFGSVFGMPRPAAGFWSN